MKIYLAFFTLFVAALLSAKGFAEDLPRSELSAENLSIETMELLKVSHRTEGLEPGLPPRYAAASAAKRAVARRLQDMTPEEREAARERIENATPEQRQEWQQQRTNFI
jgi:hypothetical protein